MKSACRPNVYVQNAELHYRLKGSILNPPLKPMAQPLELYGNLSRLDKVCYVVWFVLLGIYFYWLACIL
jgi:hypothetical protein